MNLHHTVRIPDWERIPPHKRNLWQSMAAGTYGVGTPGNFLSITGFMLVLTGLWVVSVSSLLSGTAIIGIGRLADIADGIIAHKTGTKSPFGRLLDAALDKSGAFLALIVYSIHGVLPIWLAAIIAVPNIITIAISAYAPWRHTILNPSRTGKLATAGYWVAILTFVAAKQIQANGKGLGFHLILALAYCIAISAVAAGIAASINYATIVRRGPPHRERSK